MYRQLPTSAVTSAVFIHAIACVVAFMAAGGSMTDSVAARTSVVEHQAPVVTVQPVSAERSNDTQNASHSASGITTVVPVRSSSIVTIQ